MEKDALDFIDQVWETIMKGKKKQTIVEIEKRQESSNPVHLIREEMKWFTQAMQINTIRRGGARGGRGEEEVN